MVFFLQASSTNVDVVNAEITETLALLPVATGRTPCSGIRVLEDSYPIIITEPDGKARAKVTLRNRRLQTLNHEDFSTRVSLKSNVLLQSVEATVVQATRYITLDVATVRRAAVRGIIDGKSTIALLRGASAAVQRECSAQRRAERLQPDRNGRGHGSPRA